MRRRTRRSLDMDLFRMSLYLSFILGSSPLLLVSCQHLCHQTSTYAAPFDPALAVAPRHNIHFRSFSDHWTPSCIRCRTACRWQNFHSFHFPSCHSLVSLRSVHCLVVSYSIYISKPSPGERQATAAPFPSLFFCVCWATAALLLPRSHEPL